MNLSNCVVLVLIHLAAVSACCGQVRSKLVADMEDKTDYGVAAMKGKPVVSASSVTASQGQRSLRFEYTGEGADRAAVIFPVDGAEGFDGISFDIYCEHDNGASLVVSIRQKTGGQGKAARYKAVLRMSDFIDGWTSVRLIKAAQLEAGDEPTAYAPSAADSVSPDEAVQKKQALADLDAVRAGIPVVKISTATRPPTIDGELDDPCWKEAAEMGPFVKLKENKPARRRTAARMCCDGKALYFAVRADESGVRDRIPLNRLT